MSAKREGPRLWLRPARRNVRGDGKVWPAAWIILDGSRQKGTGCAEDDLAGAEKALERYLATKHLAEVKAGPRDPATIPIADVLNLYTTEVVPNHARPHETRARIERLSDFFGDKMLSAMCGDLCREYLKSRSTDSAARRELEDLRAAIKHHQAEGRCDRIISVVLPPRRPGRDEWLERGEAARVMLAAWRYREQQKGVATDRRPRRHVAKFLLVGLYTGTRAAAICGAALQPTPGHGWIDLERGVFYRRPRGRRETKKRTPPVPLPQRLLAHLRRWKRKGQRWAVEFNGEPVKDVDKAFRNTVRSVLGSRKVSPHTLRHTAATWLMQSGADPWQSAEYLGMTLKTLLDTYGHHHPDYLRSPVDAFDRRRSAPMVHQKTTENEARVLPLNATRSAGFSKRGW